MSQEDEIRKIECLYRIKLERLREWKKNEIHRINTKHTLKFTEVCDSQGNTPGGAFSCTPISLIAVYNFLRKDQVNTHFINEMRWKRIVEHGANIYSKWSSQNNNVYAFFPFSEEVFNIELLKPVRKAISILKTFGGNLDDEKTEKCAEDERGTEYTKSLCENQPNGWKYEKSCYTLTESLSFLKGEKSAATLTIRQTTVSLFYCNGRYWLFDSHGKKSTLWECLDLSQLEMLIRDRFPLLKEFMKIGTKRVKMNSESDNTFDFVLFRKN